MRVSVLGPVRAWRGDRELALGPARQRAVFALLATAAGRPVGRNDLIDGVWDGSPPPTAIGNLYTYVSGLRRSLGHGLLVSGTSGYTLRLHPGDLDSVQFAELCARADVGRDRQPTVAGGLLDDALRLWHGEAYAGLTGHRFELERARLTRQRLAAVEQRARILTELGDDSVVAELAGLVRDHPLHEPLHELLMLALDRVGRRTEALEVYHTARRILRTELGAEPRPAFTDRYERIRGAAAPQPVEPRRFPVTLPPQVARMLRDRPADQRLTGRDDELRRLRDTLRAVADGQGGAVWVEGEPGIGKSAILTAAFADAGEWGCQLGWGVATAADLRVPLAVLVRALRPDAAPGQHRVTVPAAGTHADEAGPATPGPAGEQVLTYLRGACAIAPMVLVVDNLQWADPATVRVWSRLVAVTRRLPLLLVAAARPDPRHHQLAEVRRRVQAGDGLVLRLGPLPPEAVGQLVISLVGAPLGPKLAEVVPASGGNPLCAREMTEALLRRGVVRVDGGLAHIPHTVAVSAPDSLITAMCSTVEVLAPGTRQVLRTAALLGTAFAVGDLVAATGRAAMDVVSGLEEALAAGVVVAVGRELGFRHGFLRRALYEQIPATDRPDLHRRVAEALARHGSPVNRVAEQLAALPAVLDGWVVTWLIAHHAELARQAPRVATDLLRRALDSGMPTPSQRVQLLVGLVRMDFRQSGWPLDEACEAARSAVDPADRAEMRHLLATMLHRRGDVDTAIGILTDAMTDSAVPELWRTRHRMLLAQIRQGPLDNLDQADRTAAGLHDEAIAAGQPYEAALALQTRWLTNSVRRDHEQALRYLDQALDLLVGRPAFAGMYFHLLDNRVFTLQNLDRLDEAERTLQAATRYAIRHRLPPSLQVATAVQHYWRGRWDDTLTEVNAVTDGAPGITFLGTREPVAVAMLLHGVAALVAAHRDEPELARAHLESAEDLPASDAERECRDFLLAARATIAEQQDRPGDALAVLEPLLIPGYAPMLLRHQWLPALTRLALATGRGEVAERAVAVCADEAAREVRPARAHTAAARCRALVTGDAAPALTAAVHYRTTGRITELGAALEDAAVLLAASRQPHAAARTGGEAAELYAQLGAAWDLRRLRRRLSEYGVEPAGGQVGADHLSAG
ncbi:BTAD domain-containing putative transcriptional regulator [Micromonospora sp. HNM0581]|uniref:BTAD domain-containing putative transcriptional regulator n=1 Tax=Micromonospora sp. HNM0581 TaxID=2716341 RepID=UPI00197BF70C|nr:BTAD domain-containing putative transcriptional regulator [Micromonospora sp. HNM0581]